MTGPGVRVFVETPAIWSYPVHEGAENTGKKGFKGRAFGPDRAGHRAGIQGAIAVWIRLEKINPAKRQRRYYNLGVTQTLFGEWCLIREWGRIGSRAGQVRVDYAVSQQAALAAFHALKSAKAKRGYASIPRQLELFAPPGTGQGA